MPSEDSRVRLRELPRVDDLAARAGAIAGDLPRWALVAAARMAVESRRQAMLAGQTVDAQVSDDELTGRARELVRPSLRPVINATGVVLHTNLGRAPLALVAADRAAAIGRGYSNLEYDVDGRTRGSRHDHVAELLRTLTGADAALVVNNNAAAVVLALAALAAGREVVVSRGELVEIGGSFRIPDVMRASGARLVEVGTTNKTHPGDYEKAIGPDTAMLLKVHRSNFAVVGFTAEVLAPDLVAIGKARGVPVMIDLGSGTLVDPRSVSPAFSSEPTVAEAVASGSAVVTFSGDKLLGGPQAGVILGTAEMIARIRANPLLRALRPDKMTLAALAATLELYRDGTAMEDVPLWRMLAEPEASLRDRAQALADAACKPRGIALEVVPVTSAAGGGSLPVDELASWAVAVSATDGRSVQALEAALRAQDPPIVARIAEDRLLLDVRTLGPDDAAHVAASLKRLG